ncbi:MAG: preprotein translocase subunit SecA [Cellvibrionales bacterium TMED49]|nr:preprotein translocase subunit SecA [Porticoccaceae bacterium]OUU38859.1 MAG: preprotein translocase subunit SecA [Cellvibrionales bacterium TMED49]
MIFTILKKIIGSKNNRDLRRIKKIVAEINLLEASFELLSDTELREKTNQFRDRLASGERLDYLLAEAFATVRETARRVLAMRHFDVQLIGGITLHEGRIAEMRTGEGKTLAATLSAYLNALPANGVHIITVNDYLAKRDAQWMLPLYRALGLSLGVIQSNRGGDEAHSFYCSAHDDNGLTASTRKQAYLADITYGTNNEFGFDYLRDNMALHLEEKSQRSLNHAIVDEVDSILIDEARTPLVISGAAQDSSHLYREINRLILDLQPESVDHSGDFSVDEKTRQVDLTESGHQRVERKLVEANMLGSDQSLYQASNLGLLHHVSSALRAHYLFRVNVDYIVQNQMVVLIDEHTGRTMPGRRLSEGLHQAIEAKENLPIQQESQTLASTTFQNYFRLYRKLSGMTGTADTEAFEFRQIYGLDVMVIPTNVPVERQDLDDLVFLSEEEKFSAVIDDIKKTIAKGAPVLVGTASVETSECLSSMLKKKRIEHSVLNAKHHEREANIIENAGRPSSVTIATNMAGRGTDIVLGGNLEAELKLHQGESSEFTEKRKLAWRARHETVLAAGGLHIIGTERHESRRIDNQLRGRAGRQGDPGVTRFYLCLDDSLMRLFASDRVKTMMRSMGMEYGEAIEHSMVTKSIVKAQRKVEGRNFDMRKHLLEYDDVANDQRQVIYQQRNELLEDADISNVITNIRRDVLNQCVESYIHPESLVEQWNIAGLQRTLEADFAIKVDIQSWLENDNRLDEFMLREKIIGLVSAKDEERKLRIGEQMREVERQIMLQVLDNLWKEHLAVMDQLRQSIGLRAYAQKNPKQEYKRESFSLFEELLSKIKYETIKFLSHIQVSSQTDLAVAVERRQEEGIKREYKHGESAGPDQRQIKTSNRREPVMREGVKVGRNQPCPCRSGKKFKQCCGKI